MRTQIRKLFQHSEENHFHVSVGAVLVKGGKILAHHLKKQEIPEKWRHLIGKLDEAYTLMRESLENEESLETAVHRGIAEEFGAKGEVVRFLGSVQARLAFGGGFEKTTLYFQVACTEIGERPVDDDESYTTLEWYEPHELLALMRKQSTQMTNPDLHEGKVIEAYILANT